jgi:hypothetical protein
MMGCNRFMKLALQGWSSPIRILGNDLCTQGDLRLSSQVMQMGFEFMQLVISLPTAHGEEALFGNLGITGDCKGYFTVSS